jgi:hypothetical protein
VRALEDSELAGRLGAEGRKSVEPWLASPDDYARQVGELVERVVSSPGD